MTTRKPIHRVRDVVLVALAGLAAGGCSTPGPLHLYSTAPAGQEVHDIARDSSDRARSVSTFLASSEEITGFAYDPFTDHFFLRLSPGDHIRVVDRPAMKIKREFNLEGAAGTRGGDLAVRPRDGHLFLVDAGTPELVETTRLGKFVRRIRLQARTSAAAAVAFDATTNQLVVLDPDGRTFERYDSSGVRIGSPRRLERTVRPSLACDPESGQLYAPLEGPAPIVGIFDAEGRIVSTLRIEAGDPLIDVGPHSFLRMF